MTSQNLKPLFSFILILATLNIAAQDYKKWEQHDVKGFYKKQQISLAKNEYTNIEYDALDKDGNSIYSTKIEYKDTDYGEFTYYIKTKVNSGQYKIEVDEKVNSKLWQVKGKNIYLLFRYNPYLYKLDEGVLNVDYRDGVFYKKP